MPPKFGFFKRKTSDLFHDKKSQSNSVQSVTDKELPEIIEKEKKLVEKDMIAGLEPIRKSVLDCLDRLKNGADELEQQEIKVDNPQFESLINTSKKILITSIKKDSLIQSSEIQSYEDAVKFKNNLELLINRFGQVGDSHNRILNEFMRKQLSKLKNEFDNLSSLLKEVTKVFSDKETDINRCDACMEDLIIFKEKQSERKGKQDRLSELIEERLTIDKNIETGKSEYEDFKKSEEFLNTTDKLEKINERKNEIIMFEKNMINTVSNLSRPITKFSYQASKETQQRLAIMLNKPLEIFNESHQYLQLFNELKKQIVEKSIQIKDPDKTINQIDEIVNSLPSLSTNLKNLKEELIKLESEVNRKNLGHLEHLKAKKETYEKYSSDNIERTEEIKNDIKEIESTLKQLKTKIEKNASLITNKKYSIIEYQG